MHTRAGLPMNLVAREQQRDFYRSLIVKANVVAEETRAHVRGSIVAVGVAHATAVESLPFSPEPEWPVVEPGLLDLVDLTPVLLGKPAYFFVVSFFLRGGNDHADDHKDNEDRNDRDHVNSISAMREIAIRKCAGIVNPLRMRL